MGFPHGPLQLMRMLQSKRNRFYGVVILPNMGTDTDTNTSSQNPAGISDLVCLSLCSMNTSTQPYSNHFYWSLLSISVSGSVNIPSVPGQKEGETRFLGFMCLFPRIEKFVWKVDQSACRYKLIPF